MRNHKNIYKLLSRDNTGIAWPALEFERREENALIIRARMEQADCHARIEFNPANLETRVLCTYDLRDEWLQKEMATRYLESDEIVDAPATEETKSWAYPTYPPFIRVEAMAYLFKPWALLVDREWGKVEGNSYRDFGKLMRVVRGGGVANEMWAFYRVVVSRAEPWKVALAKKLFSTYFRPVDAPWEKISRDHYLRVDLENHRWAQALMASCAEWHRGGGDTMDRYREAHAAIMNNPGMRRSVYNWPGGIPADAFLRIVDAAGKNHFTLRRPIPRKRVTWLAMAGLVDRDPPACHLQDKVDAVLNSIPAALMEYARRLYFGHDFDDHRYTRLPSGFVIQQYRIMSDCEFPLGKSATVAALYNASRKWHLLDLRSRGEAALREMGMTDEAPVTKPPIPLPDDPRIRFLSTCRDIFDEGDTMRHCVAGYFRAAMAGTCYLFHIDEEGAPVTVEVDEYGRIRQAQGQYNAMVKKGEDSALQVLGRWGAALSEA